MKPGSPDVTGACASTGPSNNYAGSWSSVGDLFDGVQALLELVFYCPPHIFHNERTRVIIETVFFLHLSLPPGSGAKQSKGETV